MLKSHLTLTIAAVFATSLGFLSSANAANIEYKILINGVDAATHSLAAGTHTLEVQGIVTDNIITGTTPGGFLQASFDLVADTDAVVFSQGAGFIGAPNGLWDSTTNAAFQQHNAGAVNPSGDIIEETGSVLQAQWNTNFGTGANAFAFIASGPFTWNASADTTINLTTILGNQLVAFLDGANVGAMIPTGTLTTDSVLLQVGGDPNSGENTPPVVNDQMVSVGFGKTLTYQLLGTDAEDGNDANLDWAMSTLTGPGTVAIAPVLTTQGGLTWDTAGTPRGFYTATITATDSGGLEDSGLLTIQVPEPGTCVLAGLSLIGIFASRRRVS